ncbi:MAG: Fe-Mn family superoxide dismutase [Nitrospirota bacterium]|nr:Fe-Mn family superoxide dismutase [Nitrospirota bacterium]
MTYRVKRFDHLKGLRDFSDQLMANHLTLYQGYVKNTNQLAALLLNMVKLGKANTMEYAELKRRFGWEFNGMRLHELYFENLSKRPVPIRKTSPLYEKLWQDFNQFSSWERGFMGVGGMRGIGWAVLTRDPATGHLFNVWMDEHDAGFLVGSTPLLVMDVFEHAYLQEFGMNRTAYVQAFMKAIDWSVVERRFEGAALPPLQPVSVRKKAS